VRHAAIVVGMHNYKHNSIFKAQRKGERTTILTMVLRVTGDGLVVETLQTGNSVPHFLPMTRKSLLLALGHYRAQGRTERGDVVALAG
jgi:hypothetical protein